MKSIIITLTALVLLACANYPNTDETAAAFEEQFALNLQEDTMMVGCLVVEKEFIKKNNEPGGYKELYLRCSVDDYFIKLCESKVTRKELEAYIDQGISARIVLRDGEWDICEGDPVMQSRIGTYAAILEIEE